MAKTRKIKKKINSNPEVTDSLIFLLIVSFFSD